MLKSVFMLQKNADTLPIEALFRVSSPLRLAAGPAGGAHNGPPDLLAGSRERAPKGRRGVREGNKGRV